MEREQIKESLQGKSYDELLEMHGPVLNRLEELIDVRATGVKGTDDEFGTLRTKDAVISELLWEKAMEEEDEEEEEKEEEKEEGTKRDLTITISGDEVAVLKAQREIREEVFQLTGKYPDEEKKEDSDG